MITTLLAQQLPCEYNLDQKKLSKMLDQTFRSNTIEKILIHNSIIWIATSKGLSKSLDNGINWINYYNTKEFGTESVSAVAYGNGVIWASTWHNYDLGGGAIDGEGSGLRYSTDQGTTWTTIAQPINKSGDSIVVYGINNIRALPITTAVQNFIYDIALTKNTVWIATKAGGLRKSTDMGQTWERVVLPPDYLNSIKPTDKLTFSLQPKAGKFGPENNLNHIAFSILVVDDNTIFVGTAGGINKSTDGGVSWTKFNHTNQSKPISGNFILALEKNDFDNSIWAGTWKAEGSSEYWGVSSSKDGGLNWDTYLTDERVLDFGFKYLSNPGNYLGADIFVATQNGVYRSSNNGATWIAAPEIIDDNQNVSIITKHFRAVKVNRITDNSTDIWLGTLNGLARLTETTGFWSGKWKVFLSSEKLVSKHESYAFPNPFSPNKESVRIKYATSQAANVTIRILDFGMNLVRTLIQNAPRDVRDDHFALWDGKDESGKTVPNGVYFYRIDIDDSAPLFGKIMVIM